MKKILLILCLLMCSGCADYVEINNLVIIPGMILDYKDNEFEITTELILNDTSSSKKVITTKCKMINECLSDISNYANKNILLSQLKVLIITKNIITNNIDFYDYFLRNSKSKMNFNIFIIDEKLTKDLFNIKTNSNSVSLYIEKLNNSNQNIISSSEALSFIDLVYKNLEPNLEPIFPSLTIKENNNEKNIYLEHLVFYNSEKEITLNEKQSINYNILSNNINKTYFDIKCNDNLFSITIDKIKTTKNWKNNTMNFNIKVNADVDNYMCDYDLDDKDTIKKLNSIVEKEIKKNLVEVINISKENNYDFLGIGNYIYKHDNKYYKNNKDKWNLKNIKTNVNIDVSISSIGEKRI